MSTSDPSQSDCRSQRRWLAVFAFLLAVLAAADFSLLAARQAAFGDLDGQRWASAWKCPAEELRQEGITPRQCQLMAARAEALIVSLPAPQRVIVMYVALIAAVVAVASALIAMAMLRGRRRSQPALLAASGIMLATDVVLLGLLTPYGSMILADEWARLVGWAIAYAALSGALLGMRAQAEVSPSSGARALPALHLAIAVSVVFLLLESRWFLSLPWGYLRVFPTQLHKNVGITVGLALILMALISWRSPRSEALSPRWVGTLAKLAHAAMYVAMFGACASGYLSSAFSGWPTRLWWMVDLPAWAPHSEEMNELFSSMHSVCSWILLSLILLHVAGALYHVARTGGVLRRMLHW
ncbi:cytochrome b [Piscinibacter koreensis]|uniref:Cytochrome b/b6 domain-containing protein n=1 Tax=Piscinibacter koreensis TaxID=2742824 RepID=A0A7Y6TYS9_9BURK|nr:cytochrome b/b6 domain-containing protein [Schlegelella koreensis]NUZ08391.1 cytochrome b/b6 domain-containing protein [Schlegelella koreensis]